MSNKFVFVAPMYNASATLPRMLHSLFGQSYDNWRLILIDDVSSAAEVAREKTIIKQFQSLGSDRIAVTWNAEKKWEVANVLHGISMCEDDDIVCRIDADDALVDLDALAIVNHAYVSTGCEVAWSAHRWGLSDKNISGPMTPGVDPYKHPWVSSHLKTFRKKLINNIPYENFLNHEGVLARRAGDQYLYLPILYQTQKRFFINRALYSYTIDEKNGLVYATDDAKFQKLEAEFLRKRGYIKEGISWQNK
jgi:glycosyltransferase involved in cell wall biosynthesis